MYMIVRMEQPRTESVHILYSHWFPILLMHPHSPRLSGECALGKSSPEDQSPSISISNLQSPQGWG